MYFVSHKGKSFQDLSWIQDFEAPENAENGR